MHNLTIIPTWSATVAVLAAVGTSTTSISSAVLGLGSAKPALMAKMVNNASLLSLLAVIILRSEVAIIFVGVVIIIFGRWAWGAVPRSTFDFKELCHAIVALICRQSTQLKVQWTYLWSDGAGDWLLNPSIRKIPPFLFKSTFQRQQGTS